MGTALIIFVSFILIVFTFVVPLLLLFGGKEMRRLNDSHDEMFNNTTNL